MKLKKYLWKHPLESNAPGSLEKLGDGDSALPVQSDDASQPGEPEGQTGIFPSSVLLSKTQQCIYRDLFSFHKASHIFLLHPLNSLGK